MRVQKNGRNNNNYVLRFYCGQFESCVPRPASLSSLVCPPACEPNWSSKKIDLLQWVTL